MSNSFQNLFGSPDSDDSHEQPLSATEGVQSESVRDLEQSREFQQPLDFQQASSDESAPPEFGLLEVIEAFTAMRHEWRTQTRENRDLAVAVQTASDNLLRLETKLIDSSNLAEQNLREEIARELVEAIVEIDIHLGRAVEATVNSRQTDSVAEMLAESIQLDFENQGIIFRWFSRRFFKSVQRMVANHLQAIVDSSTNEGLAMVVSRIRRIMCERDIERTETVGQLFDAETMHAIASVESDRQQTGYVEEQISPVYFWRGELIRCADVRVAK